MMRKWYTGMVFDDDVVEDGIEGSMGLDDNGAAYQCGIKRSW